MHKKALVPLDGSEIAGIVFAYAQALAGGYNTITARGYEYAIYPEQQMASDRAFAENYLARVGKQLKENGVTPRVEVRPGNAAEEIIEYANGIGIDMVAMSTHGRSGVGRWVFGSVAEKVLHEGNKPLLLVRAPGARTK